MKGPTRQASAIEAITTMPATAARLFPIRPKALLSVPRRGDASLFIAYLRVQQGIEQIDDEIGDDDQSAIEDDGAHHQRVIAIRRGFDEITPDAGDGKSAFDHDRAGNDA